MTQALADIEDRLKTITEAYRTKTGENTAIIASLESDNGMLVGSTEQKEKFEANLGELKDMRAEIDLLAEQKQAIVWGAAPSRDPITPGAEALATRGGGVRKTLGQLLVESAEFKAMMDAKQLTMARPFDVGPTDLGALWLPPHARKDVYSDLPTGTPGAFGRVQRDPIVELPFRTTRVRDLFPNQPTTAAIIEYFRITGFVNSASVVPERLDDNTGFAVKPKSNLTIVGEQAATRTIAHWEAAHRNVLDDEPQLQGIVENELLYGLRLQEDFQILKGTGTGQDLLGILNVPGIQAYDQGTAPTAQPTDNKADAIRRAATLAFLSNYEPTGVVTHPNDWEDIELLKDDNGQYLLAVSIALGGEPRVWRMPVVATPAMDEDTALVGAFGIGATLYDRQQSNIRISEHHAEMFVQNAVAILAEERLALATKRPESFVEVTFTP